MREKRKKGNLLPKGILTALAAMTVLLFSVMPVWAKEIVLTEDTFFQISADKTKSSEDYFRGGPIQPGDSVTVMGKLENNYQVRGFGVDTYYYRAKDEKLYSCRVDWDDDPGNVSNVTEEFKDMVAGVEFIKTAIPTDNLGNVTYCITGFVNHTDKIIRVGSNGQGPLCEYVERDSEGNIIKSITYRKEYFYFYFYDKEYSINYDLEGGTLQGKTNPSSYTFSDDMYALKMWAPVKAGYHFSSYGEKNSNYSVFDDRAYEKENGQTCVIQEYWPGYMGMYGYYGADRYYSARYDPGYTAVFKGMGGTVNGQDEWIAEVDKISSTSYTDINFTPQRAGYTFQGWYLDKNYSQRFYGFQDDRSYDISGGENWVRPFKNGYDYITTLYAKWSDGTNPEPTKAPEVTEVPQPTKAPDITETPQPTKAPDVTEAPQPTKAPDVTETPQPTKAPDVTETPQPTKAPDVTETPQPTKAPDITETPQPTKTPEATALPAKGQTYKGKTLYYKITASTANTKTVTVMKPVKPKAKSITIPSTVKIGKYSYKVTAINAKAFRNSKYVKQVIIGKNLTRIGKQAFENCKNLKKITISSTKITKIEGKAFRKLPSGAKISVPKFKYKAYQKLLKNAGLPKTVKILKK